MRPEVELSKYARGQVQAEKELERMGGGLQRFPVTDGKRREGGIRQGTHQGVRVCVCVDDELAKEFFEVTAAWDREGVCLRNQSSSASISTLPST